MTGEVGAPEPLVVDAQGLRLGNGLFAAYPVFLPVYYREPMVPPDALHEAPGLIANAYFLYKDRPTRERVLAGLRIRDIVDHPGIIMTDSGAFQGFNRPLYLHNRSIVRFQEELGTDILSPLDLVTGPWEKRSIAEQKLVSTQKRVAEALRLSERTIVAGVQQGGRFLDLRQRAIDELLDMGVAYIALGSLVPFLTRNHDIDLVLRIIRDARERTGPGFPLHLYGAGDPVELPLFALAGANIFDSSSFAHFALADWYMTPFGAVQSGERGRVDWICECAVCAGSRNTGNEDLPALALARHNLATILAVVRRIRGLLATGTLETYVADVIDSHQRLFPTSRLQDSAGVLFS